MSENVTARGEGPSHRGVEVGTAAFMLLLGLVAIIGGLQVGINWGAEGPRAGFFPFYIGLFIVAASIFNVLRGMTENPGKLFAEWGQLRQVVAVVIPTAIYVALVPNIGIYVSSTLLIAAFMKWLGRYGWAFVLLISIGVSVATFFMFEKWFLVPLPKGPLEWLLGL